MSRLSLSSPGRANAHSSEKRQVALFREINCDRCPQMFKFRTHWLGCPNGRPASDQQYGSDFQAEPNSSHFIEVDGII